MVNLAIIGCGAITDYRHAPECHDNPDINLSGLYDLNKERAEKMAEKYNIVIPSDYKEIGE